MRVGALTRVAAAVAVALGLMLGSAASAWAVPSDQERADGLWYAKALKFDELQAAGHTGKGVKIAVIDDGINTAVPELQGANITPVSLCAADFDRTEVYPATSDDIMQVHGTNVTAMLVGNGVAGDGGLGTRGIAPQAEVLFYGLPANYDLATNARGDYKTCYPTDEDAAAVVDGRGTISYAIVAAVMAGADVISISTAVDFELFDDEYNLALAFAARAGVPVVAATPNPLNPPSAAPDLLNGVVAVGGLSLDGTPISIGSADSGRLDEGTAVGSPNLAVAAPGDLFLVPAAIDSWNPSIASGTSLATPLVAGTIALGLEAYPKATGYQVVQAMIRTTGTAGLAEPVWNDRLYGYGVLNPKAMLAVDPTQFPGENPLFVKDVSDPRCQGAETMETCAWATHPTTQDFERIWAQWDASKQQSSVEPKAKPAPKPVAVADYTLLWVLGGVLALGVIAAAIIVPIVITSSRKARAKEQVAARGQHWPGYAPSQQQTAPTHEFSSQFDERNGAQQ